MTKPTNEEPKLLLIWGENPEAIVTFLLPINSEQATWARKSSNLYINSDDIDEGHPILKLCDWLVTEEGLKHKVKPPMKQCNVTQVVLCGFMM